MKFEKWLLRIQGIYYIATGVWPVVHLSSFEYITGPKTDDWLVMMVAWLVIALGIYFIYCAEKNTDTVPVIAILSAIAFLGVSTYYVIRDVITGSYLLDSLAESAILTGWIFLFYQRNSKKRGHSHHRIEKT